MVWRRRKINKPRVEPPQPPHVTTPAPKSAPEILPPLRSLVQEAADLARRELNDTGRITPKALFIYDDESLASGTRSVVVALSSRSELQKDAVRKRIRDKAVQEGARAVLVMHEERRGILTILEVTAQARVAASVNYSFDTKTKTVNRWDIQWGAEPLSR
jgi:hypothetical protein